jgi:hypothetical protein
MAANPSFTSTPIIGSASINVANTDRTGTTGSVGSLVTGASSGTRITRVTMTATGSTTAGHVRLFVNSGSSANNRLIYETAVTAITVAAGTNGYRDGVSFPDGLVLPSGYKLECATEKGETFHVVAFGGDL